MPVTCTPVWQAKWSLRRQLSQERQCQACQPTPTHWPACHRPGTSLPAASITPTTSCPGTRGKVMPGHWPSLVKTSLWQTPQAWTLIRTDPGPGSGIGRSTSSRGPPGRETWATRIVAMRMLLSVCCGVTVGVAVSPESLFLALLRDREEFRQREPGRSEHAGLQKTAAVQPLEPAQFGAAGRGVVGVGSAKYSFPGRAGLEPLRIRHSINCGPETARSGPQVGSLSFFGWRSEANAGGQP